MKTLAFVNQKGGVAKTTSVVNIGAAMAREGQRVLLVDLDPQANLTLATNTDPQRDEQTVRGVLNGDDVHAAIWRQYTDYPYDIIPADITLSAAEVELVTRRNRYEILKRALKTTEEGYDYCLIDCAPSLGVLTLSALAAADKVYIPVQTQYLPLRGVKQLVDTIDQVKEDINPELEIGGLFCTMYRGYNLDNEAAAMIEGAFPEKVLSTRIRLNNKLAEAPSYGRDIFEYAPKSSGAKQYRELAQEILKREGSL